MADEDGVYAASVPVATGQGELLACRECGLLKTPMQARASHVLLLTCYDTTNAYDVVHMPFQSRN